MSTGCSCKYRLKAALALFMPIGPARNETSTHGNGADSKSQCQEPRWPATATWCPRACIANPRSKMYRLTPPASEAKVRCRIRNGLFVCSGAAGRLEAKGRELLIGVDRLA